MHGSKKSSGLKRENILVVERGALLEKEGLSGLLPATIDRIFETISTKGMFLERSLAENNELYKQIIPYLVYQYKNSFFLMQRGSKGGEQRLHNCYTLGIGGHVRESDLQDSQSILDWARREFLEEVIFTGNYKPVFLGLLNDDSNAVGRVHLGLVFLLRGDSKHIAIRNQEHRSGKLVSLDQLLAFKDELESWSQIVLDHLNFLLGYKEKPARAQL